MDPPTNSSRVAPEGPPTLLNSKEYPTDEEICQFLFMAAGKIGYYLDFVEDAKIWLEKWDCEQSQKKRRANIKEAGERIAALQEKVSNIGSCPIVNCAVHASNIARLNTKRPLSNSEEDLNMTNEDSDLNSFKYPPKKLTAKVKNVSVNQSETIPIDQNKFSNLEIDDAGESPDTPATVKNRPQ
ncbi:hypothetical protein AVEN_203974-1 [Araneus ventricosus]|uniref:Uncharacterized protein n=1 Tax=Araneus ventricosus TaxID=182803 RepID=A0A4Y2UK94_ARAVE|nr:hypothetical protein AVEN_203974-1 [Araneus ventricosus]